MQVALFNTNSCIQYFQVFKSLQQKKGGPLKKKHVKTTNKVWQFFLSSIRQDENVKGSLTWPGPVTWAGKLRI